MNSRSSMLSTSLLALLAGCVATSGPFISEPLGPSSAFHSPRVGIGYLQVYSETINHNDGGIFYNPHTSYTIHSPEGRKVRAVQNHIGMEDENPTVVALPPGPYNLLAQSGAFGRVTVPVVIGAGALTPVYLERGGMPPRLRKNTVSSEADFVIGPEWKSRGLANPGKAGEQINESWSGDARPNWPTII